MSFPLERRRCDDDGNPVLVGTERSARPEHHAREGDRDVVLACSAFHTSPRMERKRQNAQIQPRERHGVAHAASIDSADPTAGDAKGAALIADLR